MRPTRNSRLPPPESPFVHIVLSTILSIPGRQPPHVSFSKGPTRPTHPPAAPTRTTVDAPVGVLSDAIRARETCRAIASGDQASLATLYGAWADQAFRLARALTRRDEATCLDIVQNSFIRVIHSPSRLSRISDHEELRRWLVRVVHTAALDHLRAERRGRRREQAVAAGPGDSGPIIDRAVIQALETAIARLDAEDRALLALRFGDATSNGSLRHVAAAIDSTLGAAHGRIRRALQRLSDHL